MSVAPKGLVIQGPMKPGFEEILTPDALALLADVHRRFDDERLSLLQERLKRQARLDSGEEVLDFPAETQAIRKGDWTVPAAPADLQDRRVEITGPVDRKMLHGRFRGRFDPILGEHGRRPDQSARRQCAHNRFYR